MSDPRTAEPLTAEHVDSFRKSARAQIHPEKVGMSGNLTGPFRCPCFECARNRNIIRLCDALDAERRKGEALKAYFINRGLNEVFDRLTSASDTEKT